MGVVCPQNVRDKLFLTFSSVNKYVILTLILYRSLYPLVLTFKTFLELILHGVMSFNSLMNER